MMRRFVTGAAICIALATLVAVAAPAPVKIVRLEGWVVDEYCGAKNAKADGKQCILECHKKGSALVFASNDGDVYKMNKQKEALEFVGEEIRIFGTVDENDYLRVGSFVRLKAEEDEKTDKEPVKWTEPGG